MTTLSYQRFTRDFTLSCAGRSLTALGRLLIIPIFAKLTGPYQYGIWSLLLVAIALLSALSKLGMPQALERFLPGEDAEEKIREYLYSCLSMVSFFGLALAFAVFCSADAFSHIIFEGLEIAPLIRIAAFVLLVTSLNSVFSMFFQASRQIGMMYAFELTQLSAELILIALSLYSGFGLHGAFLSVLTVRSVAFVLALLFIISRIGISLPRFSYLRAFLAYGLPTIVFGLVYWVVESSDRYMIKFFLDPTHVGIYTAAYGIGTIMVFFRTPFITVLPPYIFKLWDDKDGQRVKIYLEYSLKYYLMVALPAFFGLSALSKPILLIMSNAQFAGPGTPVVPFIALAMFFYGLCGITDLIFWLQKRTKEVSFIWGMAALVNVILNFLLIPRAGIIGAAIATLISYTLPTMICSAIFLKETRVDIDWSFVVKACLACGGMVLFIELADPLRLVTVLWTIVVGAAIYFGIIALTKGIHKKEIEFFKSLVYGRFVEDEL